MHVVAHAATIEQSSEPAQRKLFDTFLPPVRDSMGKPLYFTLRPGPGPHDAQGASQQFNERREGGTWPPSLAVHQARAASRQGQPASRGGFPPQPPQNEAMEHQRQRDGEGGNHDQRIG